MVGGDVADKRLAPYLLLAVAIAFHVLMLGSLFWGYFDQVLYSAERSTKAVDFFAIYEAGHHALHGESLYKLALPQAAPYASPYRYVPSFAYLIGAPLNALGPWNGYWAWVAFNELLLVINAYATWRIGRRGMWGIVGAAMWFAFPQYFLELYLGQFSFLMTTLLFWTAAGLLRNDERFGGTGWVLSLLAKTNSALVAPALLRQGWWRAVVVGGLALALASGPYFLWQRDDGPEFVRVNFTGAYSARTWRVQQYWPAQHGLTDFVENTDLAIDQDAVSSPASYNIAITMVVLATCAAVTLFARRSDPLVLFAIWDASFFLFYKDVWEFHYLMFLPPLVLMVTSRPALRPAALALFIALAIPSPYWPLNHVFNTQQIPPPDFFDPIQSAWPAWGVVVYHAWRPVPMLLFWVYLVVVQCRSGLGLDWLTQQLAALRTLTARATSQAAGRP